MKINNLYLVVLMVLACPWRAVGQNTLFPEQERKVTSVYSDKTDTTIVRFGPMHLWNSINGTGLYSISDTELGVFGFFTYKGKTFVKPESVRLIFVSVNVPTNRWELTKQKDLEITAEDGNWSIPNIEVIDSQRGVALVIDWLGVSIPCEEFAKIAGAKKLKLRFGDRGRFSLTKQHAATLHELAGRTGC